MSGPMQAPHPRDLIEVPVEVEGGDEPWINTVTARSSRGDTVALTWDVVAASIFIRWTAAGSIVLELTRESVERLSIQVSAGVIVFDVLMATEGATGQLFLRIGDTVTATDSILRG